MSWGRPLSVFFLSLGPPPYRYVTKLIGLPINA